MADHDAEREKKRKKALRRMGKIVAKAWELPHAKAFQTAHNPSDLILCLTSLGQKVDEEGYRYGRHGWEDFARDIGGVYNHHLHRYVLPYYLVVVVLYILRRNCTGNTTQRVKNHHLFVFAMADWIGCIAQFNAINADKK